MDTQCSSYVMISRLPRAMYRLRTYSDEAVVSLRLVGKIAISSRYHRYSFITKPTRFNHENGRVEVQKTE